MTMSFLVGSSLGSEIDSFDSSSKLGSRGDDFLIAVETLLYTQPAEGIQI